jgi:hypothetical protein
MTALPSASKGSLGWLRDLWECGWLKGLLLVAAVVFVYQPAWHGGFIWDDNTHMAVAKTNRPGGFCHLDAFLYRDLTAGIDSGALHDALYVCG